MTLTQAIAALVEAKSMVLCHKPEERAKRYEDECRRVLIEYANSQQGDK